MNRRQSSGYEPPTSPSDEAAIKIQKLAEAEDAASAVQHEPDWRDRCFTPYVMLVLLTLINVVTTATISL